MKKLFCLLLCFPFILMFGACGAVESGVSSGLSDVGETKDEMTTEEPTTVPATEKPTEETTANGAEPEKARELSAALEETVSASGFSGVAYAVYGGKTALNFGGEYSSKTVYRIASVSKQFTAAAILKLCEQGKLSVDDTLDKFFPEYSGADTVKLHHLLAMRSGITDYIIAAQNSDGTDYGLRADNPQKENREAIKSWIFKNTVPAPDISYSYSNTNYFLLADIIEQVSGMAYEDYITENFLKPLKMDSTGFMDTWNRTDLELAPGYGDGAYGFYEYSAVRYGCGDMMSNAEDLVKWGAEFVKGKNTVLSDSMIGQMTQNYENAGYGYGVMIDENYKVVYHPGELPPYRSALSVDPETSLIIVALENKEPTEIKTLCAELLKSANSVLNG